MTARHIFAAGKRRASVASTINFIYPPPKAKGRARDR